MKVIVYADSVYPVLCIVEAHAGETSAYDIPDELIHVRNYLKERLSEVECEISDICDQIDHDKGENET